MLQEGLFMDGLIYSTTAMNLANGIGSFWQLSFTETNIQSFHGHPPLAIYLQSFFFKLLGSGYMVEKIYSFITAIVTAFLISKFWKELFRGKEAEQYSWFPVLIWITFPLVFWSYRHNLLENTMGVFTLTSCYLLLLSIKREGHNSWLFIILAGISLVAAFLSKGFPGLFPLGFFVLYLVSFRSQMVKFLMTKNIILFFVPLFAMAIILLNSNARAFLNQYLDEQVLSSISGNQQSGSHFFILFRLLQELAPLLILSFLCLTVAHFKKIQAWESVKKQELVFVGLLAVSASFPIMISPKQLGFYLVPSLPFFAMGFAVFFVPFFNRYFNMQVSRKVSIGTTAIAIVSVISILLFGYTNSHIPERDKDLVLDVRELKNELPADAVIGFTPSLASNWSLMGYLYRYYKVSLHSSYNNYDLVLTDIYSPIQDSSYVRKKELKSLILYEKLK
jgi:4-amino-4-deoxy-L-arabinose transferase-like glycosyltransferase